MEQKNCVCVREREKEREREREREREEKMLVKPPEFSSFVAVFLIKDKNTCIHSQVI